MATFSAKIRFLQQTESGEIKKVSEEYLVHAESFTEAEANLLTALETEYELLSLQIKKFDEILETLEDDHKFFKVVISHTTVDIDSGKEKKVKSTSLIQGLNAESLTDRIKQIWANSASDWSISSISETKYVQVI